MIGGYDLGKHDDKMQNHMLLAFTELRTKEEIDQLVEELGANQ
jgi:glycine dehydrogenase subunit 1